MQMVLHLGIVQLHLNVPDLEATKQALPQAEKGLQELSKCPKALQANLRLHYRLLWVCYHLALGDMETLLKSSRAPTLNDRIISLCTSE